MKIRKFAVMAGFIVLIAVLAAFGGVWSETYAQGTIPTASPSPKAPPPVQVTPVPGDLAGRFGERECQAQPMQGGEDGDVYIQRWPNSSNTTRWGGVIIPGGVASDNGVILVCGSPVRNAPHRGQLYFHRELLELRQYINGVLVTDPPTGTLKVYFDLTAYERWLYDNTPDRFGFYTYNSQEQQWQPCENVEFDAEASAYGRYSCSSDAWGFFALGYPSGHQ